MSSSSSSHSLIEIAPTGVSAWSGPTVNLTGASSDTLRVRASIPLCSVGTDPAAAVAGAGGSYNCLQFMVNSGFGGTTALRGEQTIALGPGLLPAVHSFPPAPVPTYGTVVAFPDCSLISLIASAFGKYRLIGNIKLHYMPQTTTIDPVNFALTFTDDPDHPIQGMGNYTDGTGVAWNNYASTKNSVNSIVFAAWSTWSKSFPVDNSQSYYTTGNILLSLEGTPVTFDAIPPFAGSQLRFSHFGAITGFANSKSVTEERIPKGELYLECEYEFFDFVPVTSTTTIPYALLLSGILSGQVLLPQPRGGVDPDDDSDFDTKESDSKDPKSKLLLAPRPRAATQAMIIRKLHMPVRDPPDRSSSLSTVRSNRRSVVKTTVSGKQKFQSPDPRVMAKAKLRLPSVVKGSGLKNSQILPHFFAHLNRKLDRLPKAHHQLIKNTHSVILTKKSGWRKAAIGAAKTLAKEVPVIGEILPELIEMLGGPVLDWIASLF